MWSGMWSNNRQKEDKTEILVQNNQPSLSLKINTNENNREEKTKKVMCDVYDPFETISSEKENKRKMKRCTDIYNNRL